MASLITFCLFTFGDWKCSQVWWNVWTLRSLSQSNDKSLQPCLSVSMSVSNFGGTVTGSTCDWGLTIDLRHNLPFTKVWEFVISQIHTVERYVLIPKTGGPPINQDGSLPRAKRRIPRVWMGWRSAKWSAPLSCSMFWHETLENTLVPAVIGPFLSSPKTGVQLGLIWVLHFCVSSLSVGPIYKTTSPTL